MDRTGLEPGRKLRQIAGNRLRRFGQKLAIDYSGCYTFDVYRLLIVGVGVAHSYFMFEERVDLQA